MSLRRITGLPGIGLAIGYLRELRDDLEGGSSYNDDSEDPSKPKKERVTTLGLILSNSIWLLRTTEGHIVYSIGYAQRFLQRVSAIIINGVGFAWSVGLELLFTSQSDFKKQWLPLVEELELFLIRTGIGDELARGFSTYRFLGNVGILARIQDKLWEKKGATGFSRLDRRKLEFDQGNETTISIRQDPTEAERKSILKDGKRLMKYTTAAYGCTMIDAAEIDVYGSIQTSQVTPSASSIETGTNLLTALNTSLKTTNSKKVKSATSQRTPEVQRPSSIILRRMSEHIGIPERDIYPMNLFDDQPEALRHFIAVDHTNKSIVLSLRGSFTIKELLIDVAAFSRPFCGGEAHSEMANAAELVWEETRETILKLLDENPEYELVLTGHSLGAGAASLLNILLHENDRGRVGGRSIRCFAFSSPPVFAGEIPEKAKEACINYIHDSDVVPFLSVDSVRRIFAALHAIETSRLSTWIRVLILWGSTEVIRPSTLELVERALHEAPPAKEGAPELLIPAYTNVWMRTDERGFPPELEIEEMVKYNHLLPSNFVLVDSTKLNKMGISFDPLMIANHFPNGYECALHNLR